MVYFDTQTNEYVPFLWLIEYTHYQTPAWDYDNNVDRWEKKVSSWHALDNLDVSPLELTAEQTVRLDEVNADGVSNAFEFEVRVYVEYGAVLPQSNCPLFAQKEGTPDAINGALAIRYQEKLIDLASYRFKKETGGVTIGGVECRTDRNSQALVHSARDSLHSGAVSYVDWKGKNGWMQFDQTSFEAVANAVSQHVQKCFTAEKNVDMALQALTDPSQVATFDVKAEFDNQYNQL